MGPGSTVTSADAPDHTCGLQTELHCTWAQAEGWQVDLLNDDSLQEQRNANE